MYRSYNHHLSKFKLCPTLFIARAFTATRFTAAGYDSSRPCSGGSHDIDFRKRDFWPTKRVSSPDPFTRRFLRRLGHKISNRADLSNAAQTQIRESTKPEPPCAMQLILLAKFYKLRITRYQRILIIMFVPQ